MHSIFYRGGYKYQLVGMYFHRTNIFPHTDIKTEYIQLDKDGTLVIFKGYAWDGPSGPTIDTLNFMRGSLVHDALYQLMREGHLNHIIHREKADRLLFNICREDGMNIVRAWIVYLAVKMFADAAASPKQEKIIQAPPL